MKKLLFILLMSVWCCGADKVTGQLLNLCETLHLLQPVDISGGVPAGKDVEFPYLGVPATYRLIVPVYSLPKPTGDIVPLVVNQVNVPNLQQAQGDWPTGALHVIHPHTGSNITFAEIKASADGTNCGWHALKNALCLLNVVHRPAIQKGRFLQAMQSPQALLNLLKPWLNFALPYRMNYDPAEYAIHPLGNWPSENELEMAADPSLIEGEAAEVEKALAPYQWQAGINLGSHVTVISQFAASFDDPLHAKDEHAAVLRRLCLSDDVTHAFVVNTVANSKGTSGHHWVAFLMHKVAGDITWFSCDSLGGGTYPDLKASLQRIFTQTKEQVDAFDKKRQEAPMIENSERLIQLAGQLSVENQYNFRAVLIKDAALALPGFLTKEDLVELGIAGSVAEVTDAMVDEQIQAIQLRLVYPAYFHASEPKVFASFYNPTTKRWFIEYQAQKQPHDLKLQSLPTRGETKDSAQPTRYDVAVAMMQPIVDKKQQGEAVAELLRQAATTVVPIELYWHVKFEKQYLAVFHADTNAPVALFFVPIKVVQDFFEKIWKDGYRPGEMSGQISLKDKLVWPDEVKNNVITAMQILVHWLVEHQDTWPLSTLITLEDIPDTRSIPQVKQHTPPLFGDVTHTLQDWIAMTMRKALPVKSGVVQPVFTQLLADLRTVDASLAGELEAAEKETV